MKGVKKTLRILIRTAIPICVAAAIVFGINRQIDRTVAERAPVIREHPEPFATIPDNVEDFVNEAFRDPERLLELDSREPGNELSTAF